MPAGVTYTVYHHDGVFTGVEGPRGGLRLRRVASPRPHHGWVAGWNMPGYLPDCPPQDFATFREALEYLRETLQDWREGTDGDQWDPVWTALWQVEEHSTWGFTLSGVPDLAFWIERSESDQEGATR